MTTLSLQGYAIIVDDTHITLNGDNTIPFSHLSSAYWPVGVCRHVSRDKSVCTLKTKEDTAYEKNGKECARSELAGCHVVANVQIRKYTFWSSGARVSGWSIVARSIKQRSPILGINEAKK